MFEEDSVFPDVDRRTMMKLAGTVGAAGLAGCTEITPGGSGGSGPELIATLGANVKNTDPTRINDTTSGKATDLIYEGVTFIDFEGNPQPSLAKSVKQNSDTEFTINLREGVNFHNGDEVTAQDVKASYERYEGSPREADVYDWYNSSSVADDYTLELTLKKNYAPIRFALAAVPIVPQSYAEQKVTKTASGTATPVERSKLSEEPIGTGPYTFEDREAGSYFRLTANEDYWFGGTDSMPDTPPIGTVTFRIIKGQSEQASALESASVDMINSPPAGKITSYKDNDQYTVHERIAGGFDMFIYPMHEEAGTPFQNRKVRLGTNRLIPREDIAQKVYDGQQRPAYAPVSPLADEFTSEQLQQEMKEKHAGYDPARATELLAQGFEEAGFEKPFKSTIFTNTDNPQRVDWCTLIQQEMNNTEFFDVSVDGVEFSTYLSKLLNKDSHKQNLLWAVGWSGGWDPDAYVHNVFHPKQFTPACCNVNHYDNQEIADLINQGLATYDTQERATIYEELQRKLVQDSPMGFITFSKRQEVSHSDIVSGFQTYPIDSSEYASIYEQSAGIYTEVNR